MVNKDSLGNMSLFFLFCFEFLVCFGLFLTHSDPWKGLKYVDFNCKIALRSPGGDSQGKRTQRKKNKAKRILSFIQWNISHIL